MNSAEKQNELASLARTVWGDNAVEFLIGSLSSVVTEGQLDVLINKLTRLLRSNELAISNLHQDEI